jgi:PAS domain S-box-containing protein
MLYLENNLVRGAFNADRTAVLQFLASQAAISLENARNYEALREREAQIRELVETSPIAIAIQGPQEEIELVNRKFTEVFGYTRADIPNVEAWWPRAYPDEQEREAVKREWWRRTDEAARSQGEIVPLEAKVRCKDGGERYVEFRAASVGDRTFVVLSDLTERQQVEQERERLVEASRAASRAKDQLLAVLSHELRNPLAAIRAGTDLLRQTLLSEEPSAKHAIAVIERNARLQARLVDDLLDLSRVSRGQLELMRAPVQLDSLVSMAVQTFRADAARKRVEVEVKAAPDLWVDADLDRLQQVVTNLLGNALKFTPAHGRVCVSVERAGNRGRIVVEDTGIGIEPDRLSRLFETFGDGERRPGTGLGIGLALVKSLTELHQGQVRAESAGVGRGSRFEVVLPLIEAPEGWAAMQAEERGRGPTRLLLVEDNADTRLMLVEALRMRGYQVLSAETGEAALEILGREQVDVILSDIGLPGMDGYEFLGRARAIPTVARTPALAVTGYGQERDARLARDAGFAEHLVKPVDLRSLDEHIRRSLAAAQG